MNPDNVTRLPVVHGRHARNAQNSRLQADLETARTCLEALVRHGYTVLRIQIEGARPVLWIQACAACAHLGGAWYRIDAGPGGRVYTWQANLLGCRVQWRTGAEAA